MARGEQTRRRFRLIRSPWAQAAAGLILWAGGNTLSNPVTAQTPARTEIAQYHLNKRTIQLPIQLDEQFRPILQEIRLYSKNKLSAPWTLQDKAPPSQATFTFRAPADGEYWFMMVTVDREGRCAPSDIAREEPAIAVVVDTQPPQAELTLVGTIAEGHLVQCDLRDAHLDPTRTRVQYQTADKVFRDVERVPERGNVYCIPTQANITGQIRVTGSDQAGNVVTRECTLAQLPTANKAVTAPSDPLAVPAVTPVVNQQNLIEPKSAEPKTLPQHLVGPQLQMPAPGVLEPVKSTTPPTMPPVDKTPPKHLPGALSGSPTVGAAAEPTVPQGPPLPNNPAQTMIETSIQKTVATEPLAGPNLGSSQATAATAPATTQATKTTTPAAQPQGQPATIAAKQEGSPVHHLLVNSTRVFLEYRIEQGGASGVGRVEVWCTRDKGQSWQRICENRDRKSPAEAQLPGDGIYGLTLVVSNGLGFGALPPVPGDTPDWWIEVDTTQPVAQITTVRLSTEDGPAVHIGWTSKDRNLGSGPVDLSYAVNRHGPWMPVAKGLKGDGQFRWVPPADIGAQAFFRLTVRDLAGNTTMTETTQPVALDDLSRPRALIVGITTDTAVTPVSAPKNGGH
jgi:hypothetical protein